MWKYPRQCTLALIDRGVINYLGYCDALSAQEVADNWLNTGTVQGGRVCEGSKKAKPLKTYTDKPLMRIRDVAKKLSKNKRYIFVSYITETLDSFMSVFEI